MTPRPRLLYTPEAYVATTPTAIVEQYPFAQLITTSAQGILATSTPILFESDADREVLVGHIARANPQAASMEPGQPVLAIFSGPHAYISAGWYRDLPSVPTWNYLSAHVRGRLEPIDDAPGLVSILRRTATVVESTSATPWTMEQAPPGRVDALLPHIRGFRIVIERIEAVTKLSQKHPSTDRARVVQQLLARGDSDSVEIARLMMHLD